MNGATEKHILDLKRIVQFLRSCREESIPTERARESLIEMGFATVLISEADRRINDPLLLDGEQEDDEEFALLLILLTKLRLEMRTGAGQSHSQPARLSLVPPPPMAPPEAIAYSEEETKPCLTAAQMPSETPPLANNVALQSLMRAVPTALMVVLVAWAALHMPQARKPGLHIHEALMAAPPSAMIQGPALKTVAGTVVPASRALTPDQIQGQILGRVPAASALDSNADRKEDAAGDASSNGKTMAPHILYHRLKTSLHDGITPVASASVPGEDVRTPKLLDSDHPRRSKTIWWHEDEAKRAVASDLE